MIGVFAALSQLKIAPAIVNGLYYAILAIIVGSAVVAIGGGGIATMRRYWEQTSASLEAKGRELKANADPEAARRKMQEMQTQVMPRNPASGATPWTERP
jgi:H+/gluconate symporter-like permease